MTATSDSESATPTPSATAVADEGGDPACWAHRVCRECGRLSDVERPETCTECGTPFSAG